MFFSAFAHEQSDNVTNIQEEELVVVLLFNRVENVTDKVREMSVGHLLSTRMYFDDDVSTNTPGTTSSPQTAVHWRCDSAQSGSAGITSKAETQHHCEEPQ